MKTKSEALNKYLLKQKENDENYSENSSFNSRSSKNSDNKFNYDNKIINNRDSDYKIEETKYINEESSNIDINNNQNIRYDSDSENKSEKEEQSYNDNNDLELNEERVFKNGVLNNNNNKNDLNKSQKIKSLDKDTIKKQVLNDFNHESLKIWFSGVKQLEISLNKKLEEKKMIELKKSGVNIDKYLEEKNIEKLKNRYDSEDPINLMKENNLIQNLNDNSDKHDKIILTLGKKCKFNNSENRFGISPGYMWDGVNRSNGFEKKYLKKENEINEKIQKKYAFRSEDM